MLYLLSRDDHRYCLVSTSGAADGWYIDISDISTALPYKYTIDADCNTLEETFLNNDHFIVATFSSISEFHNLPQTHPELFI